MNQDLKKELLKNNFSFEEITDEILSIKNFLTKNEIDFLFNIINNSSQKDWEVEYMSNLKHFCLTKFGRDDVDNLVKEGKFEITYNWIDKNISISNYKEQSIIFTKLSKIIENVFPSLELSGLATIQRMQPGVELKSHHDQHTDPSIQYATIIYINDDYKDGEIFFDNLDLSLKPKSGDLLFFPGDKKHKHGVKHVGEGPIRYVLVGFIKEKNYYENNKY